MIRNEGFLVPAYTLLPADARGVPFAYGGYSFLHIADSDSALRAVIKVYRLEHGVPQPVSYHFETIAEPAGLGIRLGDSPHRVLVIPDTLRAGQRYLFLADFADNPVAEVRVDRRSAHEMAAEDAVTLALDPPVRETVHASTRGGMCGVQFPGVTVHVRMALPDGLFYARGAFLYYTRIDSTQDWHPEESLCQQLPTGRSWVEPGEDRVYMRCHTAQRDTTARFDAKGRRMVKLDHADMADEQGVRTGRHDIEMIAWLPGTDVVFRAEGAADFRCGEGAGQ